MLVLHLQVGSDTIRMGSVQPDHFLKRLVLAKFHFWLPELQAFLFLIAGILGPEFVTSHICQKSSTNPTPPGVPASLPPNPQVRSPPAENVPQSRRKSLTRGAGKRIIHSCAKRTKRFGRHLENRILRIQIGIQASMKKPVGSWEERNKFRPRPKKSRPHLWGGHHQRSYVSCASPSGGRAFNGEFDPGSG